MEHQCHTSAWPLRFLDLASIPGWFKKSITAHLVYGIASYIWVGDCWLIYQTFIYIHGRGRYVLHCFTQNFLKYEGFLKWGYPQIIHFSRIFHYKPSLLGFSHFRKTPFQEDPICAQTRLVLQEEALFNLSISHLRGRNV